MSPRIIRVFCGTALCLIMGQSCSTPLSNTDESYPWDDVDSDFQMDKDSFWMKDFGHCAGICSFARWMYLAQPDGLRMRDLYPQSGGKCTLEELEIAEEAHDNRGLVDAYSLPTNDTPTIDKTTARAIYTSLEEGKPEILVVATGDFEHQHAILVTAYRDGKFIAYDPSLGPDCPWNGSRSFSEIPYDPETGFADYDVEYYAFTVFAHYRTVSNWDQVMRNIWQSSWKNAWAYNCATDNAYAQDVVDHGNIDDFGDKHGQPSDALGPPDYVDVAETPDDPGAFAMDAGWSIFDIGYTFIDGPGSDIMIYCWVESGCCEGDNYLEVLVSEFPEGPWDPVGEARQEKNPHHDIDLSSSGISSARYMRLVSHYDGSGNPHTNPWAGPLLDAIEVHYACLD